VKSGQSEFGEVMVHISGYKKVSISGLPSAGFTIVELVVTITIGAILLAIALPNFRELSIKSNVTETNNQLTGALNLARSEAVRRGTLVEVISTSGGPAWTAGWTIKADSGFDNTFATVINVGTAAPAGYSVCANATGATGLGGNQRVIFNGTGAQNGATSFDINVNRPDANKPKSSHISILGSGEVQSQRDTTSSPAPSSC
jgi:type IV fimbrial biogenesis protein FimT